MLQVGLFGFAPTADNICENDIKAHSFHLIILFLLPDLIFHEYFYLHRTLKIICPHVSDSGLNVKWTHIVISWLLCKSHSARVLKFALLLLDSEGSTEEAEFSVTQRRKDSTGSSCSNEKTVKQNTSINATTS